MAIRTVIAGVFIFSGCFFVLVAAVGIVRFPDFFSRIHPAGKTDTLGQALLFLGMLIYEGFTFVSIKILIIIAFLLVANPTATHAIANAAYAVGLKPWQKGEPRR